MNKKYLSTINDVSIKNMLLTKDNIYVLEELLHKESQKLEKLQKLKEENKLDFGKTVSIDELTELFPKISTEVNDFLKIDNIKLPKFSYFNILKPGLLNTYLLMMYVSSTCILMNSLPQIIFNPNAGNSIKIGLGMMALAQSINIHSQIRKSGYSGLTKEVFLEKAVRINLVSAIAHEYTHHIQKEQKINSKKHNIFAEGHARGVEKELSNKYCQKENNEAFLYSNLDNSIGEFKSAYLWMSEKLNHKVEKELFKVKSNQDRSELLERKKYGEPTMHALGNTFFSIYEALKGKEIYGEILKGKLNFSY